MRENVAEENQGPMESHLNRALMFVAPEIDLLPRQKSRDVFSKIGENHIGTGAFNR